MIAVPEEWVRHDVGSVFVPRFDRALSSWLGTRSTMYVDAEACGNAVASEHHGDLSSCDHLVEPEYLLGNIRRARVVELLALLQQRAFGDAERDTRPEYCRSCAVRFAGNGECPENRFLRTPTGEIGFSCLCAGHEFVITRIGGLMRILPTCSARATMPTRSWPCWPRRAVTIPAPVEAAANPGGGISAESPKAGQEHNSTGTGASFVPP